MSLSGLRGWFYSSYDLTKMGKKKGLGRILVALRVLMG